MNVFIEVTFLTDGDKVLINVDSIVRIQLLDGIVEILQVYGSSYRILEIRETYEEIKAMV